MDVKLDVVKKAAVGRQVIKWKNVSNVDINEMRFYMYLNSFKNLETTFLKGSGGVIFGSDITKRNKNEWGYIAINNCKVKGTKDTLIWKYIQPNDGNPKDESVLSLTLQKPIKPGETIELEMNFVSKLPRFIARAGYSRDDYYAFLHWFPQPGVFEKNKEGKWDWNCHQFFRSTEFYGEFSNYRVSLEVPERFVVSSSGCQEEIVKKNGNKVIKIIGKDLIDFAWIAYPKFELYEDSYKGIDIKMYIPNEHCDMAPRYMQSLKNALAFFEERIGTYPYPSISLVDPPMHGLGSGFMEYPMMITCASFHYVPQGIKTIESLAVHEFSHQYFMGILANNEKEEAWLDEGFVTFMEDEIADHFYGEKKSIFNILGYQSGNKERSRLEYTTMDNLHDGPIARPGWHFNEGNFKELIYAKTATILQTLKGLVGENKFYGILKHYYQKHQFTHPKEADFIACVKDIVGDTIEQMPIDYFFRETLHGTEFCDNEITTISKNSFTVKQNGMLIFPLEIKVNYRDKSHEIIKYYSQDKSKTIATANNKEIESVIIDPFQKIYLDINFNNNSKTNISETRPAVNYASKAVSWFQHIAQTLTFFI